jgi:hypothetical protein
MWRNVKVGFVFVNAEKKDLSLIAICLQAIQSLVVVQQKNGTVCPIQELIVLGAA